MLPTGLTAAKGTGPLIQTAAREHAIYVVSTGRAYLYRHSYLDYIVQRVVAARNWMGVPPERAAKAAPPKESSGEIE